MGFNPCPPFLFHVFRSQETLQNVWYTAEEPLSDLQEKRTATSCASWSEAVRAVSRSRVPRAEALHALHETYRQIIDLGLGLQDLGRS